MTKIAIAPELASVILQRRTRAGVSRAHPLGGRDSACCYRATTAPRSTPSSAFNLAARLGSSASASGRSTTSIRSPSPSTRDVVASNGFGHRSSSTSTSPSTRSCSPTSTGCSTFGVRTSNRSAATTSSPSRASKSRPKSPQCDTSSSPPPGTLLGAASVSHTHECSPTAHDQHSNSEPSTTYLTLRQICSRTRATSEPVTSKFRGTIRQRLTNDLHREDP